MATEGTRCVMVNNNVMVCNGQQDDSSTNDGQPEATSLISTHVQ